MNLRVKIKWRGSEISAQTIAAAERGVKKGAEHILAESKKHVPFDEGTLENSGAVSSNGTKATIFYDTPYAVRLHEHPEYHFKGKGRGKWLELAALKEQKNVLTIIASEIKKSLRR